MGEISLIIARKTPSRNDFLVGPGGQDYWKIEELKKVWREELALAAGRHADPEKVWGHLSAQCLKLAANGKTCAMFRKVLVKRILGPRERPYDDDNIAGGTKYLTDFLVALGLVFRDDYRHCVRAYDQSERGVQPLTIITISEEP